MPEDIQSLDSQCETHPCLASQVLVAPLFAYRIPHYENGYPNNELQFSTRSKVYIAHPKLQNSRGTEPS